MPLSPTDLTLTFRNPDPHGPASRPGPQFCVHALLSSTMFRLRLLAWTALPVLCHQFGSERQTHDPGRVRGHGGPVIALAQKSPAVGVGAVLIPGLILASGLTDRLTRARAVAGSQGVVERTAVWHAAWELFREHPLLGSGFKAFKEQAAPLVRQARCQSVSVRSENLEDAHYIVLHILAESGLLGLACMAVLFGSPCALGVAGPPRHPHGLGLGAAIFLVLAHTHLHMHLYSTNVHGLVFLLLAFCKGLSSRQEEPCA